MKYRLIATDFDYTLANTPFLPTERAKNAIRLFQRQGGLFTLVTGRMTRGILARMEGINPSLPIVSYQGAVVFDTKENKIVKDWNISTEKALMLLDELTEKDFMFNVYIGDELWLPQEYPGTRAYCEANKIDFNLCKDIKKFIDENKFTLPKMLAIMPPDQAREMEAFYSEKYRGVFCVTRSSPYYLEFTDAEASKGNALRWIAEKNGIDRSEIMSLGDSTNDLSMLEYASLGVAMGNAMPEVKEKADLVIGDCGDDGWAEFVETCL